MKRIDNSGLEFRQVDPARRRFRRYHLNECTSLFGQPALLISWGRIGQPPRVRVEVFPSRRARSARFRELLERRAAHGYAQVGPALGA